MRGKGPPFALSLSKGEGGGWFDRLTTNGEGAVCPEEERPFALSVSKGEGGAGFDRLTTNGLRYPRRFTLPRAVATLFQAAHAHITTPGGACV